TSFVQFSFSAPMLNLIAVNLGMRVFFWLNLIAGAICVAGIIAGLIVQFKNKNKSNDTNAVTFYFTTQFATTSYDEVIADYSAVANRIQAQLTNQLNEATTGNRNSGQERGMCCRGATVTVLGIGENPDGGVNVVCGISYTASRAPSLIELHAKINSIPGAAVVKAIDSSELDGVAPSEQVCSPSECSAGTLTTLFQSLTCPPCPTEKECPSIPACPTKPTYPVGLSCKADLGILLDSSSAISRVEYKEMIDFIRDQLAPMWIIGTKSTEVVLGIYSAEKVVWKSNNFSYVDNSELEHDLDDLSNEESLGSPGLKRALAGMRSIVNNRRVDTKIVTIVFTSTSSQADIDASMDDANALTKDDDTLIMVGINEKVNVHMLSTLNAFTVQGSSFDDKIALQINSAICIGKPNPPHSSTSTPSTTPISTQPPSTTPISTQPPSTTPIPTQPPSTTPISTQPPSTTPMSTQPPSTTPISTQPRPNANLPCNIDVGVYLDGSTAISRAEYAEEVRFLQEKLAKKWYVSPSWTDVSIGAYGSDGAPWFGGFWYHEAESYEIDLKNMSNIGPLGPPSVERALIATKWLIENRQRYMHVAAYIIFTYTSNETDLSAAKPYADYVATSGNDLIVVGMGSDFNANTLQNILGLQPITSITFSDALADEIADAICKDKTTVPTHPPRPGLGCDVDVLIAMDLSKAVPANSYSNQFNFLRDQVVSTWNINPWETEVAVGMFQSTTASWGAYAFRYANDAAFNEIFSIYAKKTPRYSTNIAFGMESIQSKIEERRPGKRVAALAFLYSAEQADIEAAQPFAEQIVSDGDKLLIIAVGSSANVDLFRMLSNETLQLMDFNANAANQINEMICAQ
uniref:VWFA domain-containing protein n=2 Tax=Parascaris univalens TaxID=6257 RepID=A0A914ZNF2_PARUN